MAGQLRRPGRRTGDPLDPAQVRLWPEVGRFEVLSGPADVEASYHYGLFSRIGAGPYDRRLPGVPAATDPQPVARVPGGSAISLPDAIAALGPRGTVVITDGLTLPAAGPAGPGAPIADITIRGDDQQRAVIRITPGTGPWIFQGPAAPGQPGARLRLEGILLSGTDLVLRGRFDEVVLSCCTLDPGTSGDLRTPPEVWDRSVDGRDLSPATIWAEGDVRTLTVDRCITGPIRTRQNGLIETLTVTDSVLQGLPSEPGPALTALRDADGMFAALKHHRDPLSDWLASQLSAPSAAAVSGHADGDPVPAADQQLIVADLQTVIDGALVWSAARFACCSAARLDPGRGAGPANRSRAGRPQPAAARRGLPPRPRRRRARGRSRTGQAVPLHRSRPRLPAPAGVQRVDPG